MQRQSQYNDIYCRDLERQLRQIVLDYTTKINNLICIVNKQSAQIKLDCITCDTGVPVFLGVRNSFALATDSNGKIITATNVYNKQEVYNKEEITDLIQENKTKIISFIVGDGQLYSPSDGDISYINPTLAGKFGGLILRNGLPLLTGISYRPGGGFNLITVGDQFNNGEQFVWIII